jgi:hypothetical protein
LCKKTNKYEIIQDYKLIDCRESKDDKTDSLAINRKNKKMVLLYEQFEQEKADRFAWKVKSEDSLNKKRIVLASSKQYYHDFGMNGFLNNKVSIQEMLESLAGQIQSNLNKNFGIEIDSRVNAWLLEFSKHPKAVLNRIQNSQKAKKDLIYYVKLFSADNFKLFIDAIQNNDRASLGNYIVNLMVLMSQDEYSFHRFFQAKPGTLKIEGTCGHFYFVEYAEPLTYLVRPMSDSSRKKLALKFLDLIDQLETNYLINEKFVEDENKTIKPTAKSVILPIQICDARLDNFGFDFQGELKLINVEKVKSDASVFYEKVCISHEDCSYFDCKGHCNPATKKCSTFRINNNLQLLCDKIFSNPWVEADGVLAGLSEKNSNVKHELRKLMSKCRDENFDFKSNKSKETNPELVYLFRILLEKIK